MVSFFKCANMASFKSSSTWRKLPPQRPVNPTAELAKQKTQWLESSQQTHKWLESCNFSERKDERWVGQWQVMVWECLSMFSLLVILAAWKICQFHPTKKTTQTHKQTNSKERVEDVCVISSPHPIQKNQTRPLKDKNERIIPKVSKPRASNHHFPGSRFLEFEYQSSANVLTTECD